MESKCIKMTRGVHKRLKLLSVGLGLPMGTTLRFLLDNYKPMPIEDELALMREPDQTDDEDDRSANP